MNQVQKAGNSNSIAIEDTLQAIASPVQDKWDDRDFTYVTVGNGLGQLETIVYKDGVTTVATRTFGYDANDQLTDDTTV